MQTKIKPKTPSKIGSKLKRFTHRVSLFNGELGIKKSDLLLISALLHHLCSDEISKVEIFESGLFVTRTTNLYKVKYKLETLLHGKAK